jgi:hypothetical protein
MRKHKYPQIKHLFTEDRNAYQREWRKLNPKYNKVKDEWRKLDEQTFTELPEDAVLIPNFPTYYARPNGEIWRDTRQLESAIKCGKARVLKLKQTFNKHNGYLIVQPYIGLKRHAVHVHRLILTTFNGPAPEEGMECHHIDENRTNNSIDNLMWVTRLENIRFVPFEKMSKPKKKLTEGRKVKGHTWGEYYVQIRDFKKFGLKNTEIAELLGIDRFLIHSIVKTVLKLDSLGRI